MVTSYTRKPDGSYEVNSDKKQITVEPAVELPALLRRVRKAWHKFEGTLRSSLADAITLGKELLALKESTEHGQFGRHFSDHVAPVEGALPFTKRWAQKLMVMADNPVIEAAKANHDSPLPSDLNTVYELATMTAPALEAAIEAGKVTPATTRAEAKEIKRDTQPSKPPVSDDQQQRARKQRSERDVLEDAAQAIEEAIGTALLAYPDLRSALATRLRLIEKGLRNDD
jgi:hypothetical protein